MLFPSLLNLKDGFVELQMALRSPSLKSIMKTFHVEKNGFWSPCHPLCEHQPFSQRSHDVVISRGAFDSQTHGVGGRACAHQPSCSTRKARLRVWHGTPGWVSAVLQKAVFEDLVLVLQDDLHVWPAQKTNARDIATMCLIKHCPTSTNIGF